MIGAYRFCSGSAVAVMLALVMLFLATTPGLLFAEASFASPIRCIPASDNPILGCWKRLYKQDRAIWSFHPDGYMRNGYAADLALGKPQLTGAYRLEEWSGRYVLRVEDAKGGSQWPILVVDFPSHDRMLWFRPDGVTPFGQWQRVEFIPRFPENTDQLRHIFRSRTGHYPLDTETNRRAILETITPTNFVGIDNRGNEIYFQNNPDGSQNWTYVRNGLIQNAGINKEHRYGFDPAERKVIELW